MFYTMPLNSVLLKNKEEPPAFSCGLFLVFATGVFVSLYHQKLCQKNVL